MLHFLFYPGSIVFYLRKLHPFVIDVANNSKIILYLDSIFIFYFFLSLFNLYTWTKLFLREIVRRKKHIRTYFVYNYIHLYETKKIYMNTKNFLSDYESSQSYSFFFYNCSINKLAASSSLNILIYNSLILFHITDFN